MGQTTKHLVIDQNNNGRIEAGEVIGLSVDMEDEKELRKKLANKYEKRLVSPNEQMIDRSPTL